MRRNTNSCCLRILFYATSKMKEWFIEQHKIIWIKCKHSNLSSPILKYVISTYRYFSCNSFTKSLYFAKWFLFECIFCTQIDLHILFNVRNTTRFSISFFKLEELLLEFLYSIINRKQCMRFHVT